MALNPRTVHVGGPMIKINDFPASTTIRPGMEIELHRDTDGAKKWRPKNSATTVPTRTFALEILGKGPDDEYAKDDLVMAAEYQRGGLVWALLSSGQNIQNAEALQSAGGGLLQSASSDAAADGVAVYKSYEELGSITATTRCVVEIVG